jgi:hypothetical protein
MPDKMGSYVTHLEQAEKYKYIIVIGETQRDEPTLKT